MLAITRGLSPRLEFGERTHMGREPLDLQKATRQHEAYERCLTELGCRVERLATEPDLADSVFVEDAAVVFDELALITRPGAISRRRETPAVADALSAFRRLERIRAPGTLDGGDVLVVGQDVYVGLGGRTNQDGFDQLAQRIAPHGYHAQAVTFRECLHLKSAVTRVAPRTVLHNPAWFDASGFDGLRTIETHPDEPFAANALLLAGNVVFPERFPLTRRRLDAAGLRVVNVELSELAKAEGAITCCSLLFEP